MSPARPRRSLRDVEPYEAPQLDVTARLNTNESPYPLPDGFAEDLAHAVGALSLNRYPDREAVELRRELADRNDHHVDGVWAANGSNEILVQLLQALLGALRAEGCVLIKLNVGEDRLAELLEFVPAMKSPTVSSLSGGGYALETVVDKAEVNRLIPMLKQHGATDVLELPISKIVP